jgi:hypothetical protein
LSVLRHQDGAASIIGTKEQRLARIAGIAVTARDRWHSEKQDLTICQRPVTSRRLGGPSFPNPRLSAFIRGKLLLSVSAVFIGDFSRFFLLCVLCGEKVFADG